MIVEDAAELEALAAEVIVLRRSQQHSQSLAHRKEIIDALLKRARTASLSGAALAQRLGQDRSSDPPFKTALARIAEWRSALDDDLGRALGGDLFSGLQESVSKAVRELEHRATASWQQYRAQNIPEVSGEVLAALADDPRARLTVAKIRTLIQKLRAISERSIPSLEDVTEFDAATGELRRVWATLDVASLNDEVVAFLRAANSDRGAPLGLLTTSVTEWLEQRGAASHYVIRPAVR